MRGRLVALHARFQSTRPVRGATTATALPRRINQPFQSTRPVRGATTALENTPPGETVSIHAPREGRDRSETASLSRCLIVSIHAPREGRDAESSVAVSAAVRVSIHAPREGRDVAVSVSFHLPHLFQSTRPVRGATSGTHPYSASGECFNPRAP